MTVLQQIRNYYQQATAASALAKKLTERVVTQDGIKAHLTPEDYFAKHILRHDDNDNTPQNGQLLSQQI